MNAEEIRKKAIECFYTFSAMCHSKESETDEEFNTICHCEYNEVANVASCSAVYGYEHGFADGIEIGRNEVITELIATSKRDELSPRIALDILNRGIEKGKTLALNEIRNKTIEEMAQTIRNEDDDTSECWSKCQHTDDGMSCTKCVLERAIMQLKES